MKLTINGNLNTYYAQTLCLLFFPGAKFSQSEELTADTPQVHMELLEQGEGVQATIRIQVGDQVAEGTHYASYRRRAAEEGELVRKIAAGKAMIAAGKQMFGAAPPWGLMTGVRPAKIAAGFFERGLSADAVRTALRREFFLNPKKAALLTTITENENKIISAMPQNSCSVYVSIPFCPTRCAYCSFVSSSTKRLLSLIPDYLERLYLEIDEIFETIRQLGLSVTTVYIGGGTPSILDADQLAALLSRINSHVDPATLAEYTLEAGRPDTITEEKVAVAVANGVTRMSINPQTVNDQILAHIGRRHTAEDFFRAYDIARESGIKYINTDLIAGLPGEGYASFSRSMDAMLKLRPENITVHTFCVKKAADIVRQDAGVYERSSGDVEKSVNYSQVQAAMAGYLPYYIYRQKNTVGNLENVGFALPGAEGLYNIYMMEEVHSIFAAGAGAVTKLVRFPENRIKRIFKPKYPYEYLALDFSPEANAARREEILAFFS